MRRAGRPGWRRRASRSQKPSLPEILHRLVAVARCPRRSTWKLVIMSLPWKLKSTSRRTPAITDSSSAAQPEPDLERCRAGEVVAGDAPELPAPGGEPADQHKDRRTCTPPRSPTTWAIHTSDVPELVAPVQRRGEHSVFHPGKVPRLLLQLPSCLTAGRESIESPFSVADAVPGGGRGTVQPWRGDSR